MTNLPEQAQWPAGIYQWETSDPVEGGVDGIDNLPTKQLADRTRWLKERHQTRLVASEFAGQESVSIEHGLDLDVYALNATLQPGADPEGSLGDVWMEYTPTHVIVHHTGEYDDEFTLVLNITKRSATV